MKNMFQIFEIQGKRFEYSNNIRAQKLSNPNPNFRDSRKKIRIRIYSIISAVSRCKSLKGWMALRIHANQPHNIFIVKVRVSTFMFSVAASHLRVWTAPEKLLLIRRGPIWIHCWIDNQSSIIHCDCNGGGDIQPCHPSPPGPLRSPTQGAKHKPILNLKPNPPGLIWMRKASCKRRLGLL